MTHISTRLSTNSMSYDSAPTSQDEQAPADRFEVRPYFADGVYASARAARDRAAAANQARIDNPIAMAKAIRDVYEVHPLVGIIKEAFVQLGKERQRAVVYWFDGLPLALTERGFRDEKGHPLGDKLPLPAQISAASACQRIDLALAKLAEAPEKFVVPEPRRSEGPAKSPAYASSSSLCVPRQGDAHVRPTEWYDLETGPRQAPPAQPTARRRKGSIGKRLFYFLKSPKRSCSRRV